MKLWMPGNLHKPYSSAQCLCIVGTHLLNWPHFFLTIYMWSTATKGGPRFCGVWSSHNSGDLSKKIIALAGVAQCLERCTLTESLRAWFPVRAHAQAAGSSQVRVEARVIPGPRADPGPGWVQRQPTTNWCFSGINVSAFLSLSLKKQMKKCPRVRIENKFDTNVIFL